MKLFFEGGECDEQIAHTWAKLFFAYLVEICNTFVRGKCF
jgi:hypothetical protein